MEQEAQIALTKYPFIELQVEHNMEHMLQHYSAEGWLTYREPAHLSRSTSVRVRPPHHLQLCHTVLCVRHSMQAGTYQHQHCHCRSHKFGIAFSEMHCLIHTSDLFGLGHVQSQAQSVTKEMVEGGTDAPAETDTLRLHNQFNFNERAVQVTLPCVCIL